MSAEDNKQSLTLTVGEFQFRVRVAPGEVERYRRIEATANDALRQVEAGAGALAGPRALAMALFQLAVELDDARAAQRLAQDSRDRVSRLIGRIDQATGGQATGGQATDSGAPKPQGPAPSPAPGAAAGDSAGSGSAAPKSFDPRQS